MARPCCMCEPQPKRDSEHGRRTDCCPLRRWVERLAPRQVLATRDTSRSERKTPILFFAYGSVFHKSELPHRCITLQNTEQESERQSSIMETIQEEEEAQQEEFIAVAVMSRMPVILRVDGSRRRR